MRDLDLNNSPLLMLAVSRYFEESEQGSIIQLNRSGRIMRVNSVFREYFSVRNKDCIGKHLSKFVIVDSIDQLLAPYYHSNADDLPKISAVKKDGEIVKSAYCMFKVCDEIYLLFLYDLKPKRQPIELKQRFPGTFMKDVNLGVLIIDMKFVLQDISDMACKILGVERDLVLNKPMEEAFPHLPIEHQLVRRTLLEGQVVRNFAFSWTNNHERYELLMDANLLRDDTGELIGAYVFFKDVSNLRSLEEQVQRSDRLAMIGQISAGTAHEIRNPLTSIKGFLQILNKTLKAKEMIKEYQFTEIMLNEIDRINNLVSEFLLLSKPKNASLSKVNFSTVIREILPIIHNEALLHNVTVQYEPKYDLPTVVADRELLKQVFLNISKNGIESMGESGGILTLLENYDAEERKVYIDIHDTGPGIPAFLIDKIFDPFFTTKEKGTGLGLSVCQRIVHDMGGTIRVSSKGYGTTFSISVPYTDD